MKINDVIKSGQAYSESKAAVLNIVYTEKLLSEKISAILKNYDLSTEQFNVLRILRGQKGSPASMQLIQERMLSKTSNTTRLVDKLLAKKLVTRKVCPGNRRMMEVNITESGLALLEKADPDIESFESSFNALSEPEFETFNRLIEKFRAHLLK
ncbi:MarR family winged helix-turn-helix transcriptional regulator [Flavobacterium silvaticum]|uniref:MarR family transcriptional regulator n=1 Tax=Flavobacterium silvaticum TaxID=1852020 RepID=A0A972FMK1_9FLAO|nr:MarR family transcriptional regulator [Flavobacterium silvaticum]NMH27985.1 MarR family transcriptional regulator [Flavobacterium silvaticum]